MSTAPLMPKATAIWLIENTTLTFEQIADFCQLHALEVQAIADGDIALGMVGRDPIMAGDVDLEDIEKCSADPKARLTLKPPKEHLPKSKARGKYTPVNKRHDKPAAILWIILNHPEIKDADIIRLLGTTKNSIKALREKNHKNFNEIQPRNPVASELCTDAEWRELIAKYHKA